MPFTVSYMQRFVIEGMGHKRCGEARARRMRNYLVRKGYLQHDRWHTPRKRNSATGEEHSRYSIYRVYTPSAPTSHLLCTQNDPVKAALASMARALGVPIAEGDP
jgi:hypothetical protein